MDTVYDSDGGLYYSQSSPPSSSDSYSAAGSRLLQTESSAQSELEIMADIEADGANGTALAESAHKAKSSDGQKKGSCYGTLMQMDLKKDMFLVGDIFMRKYYSVFDRDNDRVGLAEAIRITNPTN